MKTIYTILIISISTISFSQNWNLVNQNKIVFFQHSDSTNITNTIVIDSTLINGINTNYYTGYAFKYCDTCQGFSYYEPIIYRYAKELLGFTIENDIINNQYNLDNNTIKQHSQLNDTWAFNTNLNATVINATEQLILGVLDSVKTIQLSNTDTIIISKNNGVIRYPDFENTGKYYELVGYHEGQNSFGEYLPNFWRIYDFNVGDVLSYDVHISSQCHYDHYNASVKIIDNLSSGDSLTFRVKTLFSFYSWSSEPGCEYDSYTYNNTHIINAVNDKKRYENTFGKQSVDNTFNLMNNVYPIMASWFSDTPEIIGSKHFEDPLFGTTKRIYYFIPEGDSLLKGIEYSHDLYLSDKFGAILLDPNPILGDIYTSLLVGAIINGDTTGTVYNFPDDLGFEEKSIQNQLSFYPNPTINQITINTKLSNLKIYSNLGQLVLELNQPNRVIDVSQLLQGLYFIKGTDFKAKSYASKLIIK